MDELKARLAANEATMGAVQETLHRIDRSLDRLGISSEAVGTSLAVQTARADSVDLRLLQFRESFDNHIKDDAVAFAKVSEKLDENRDKILERIEGLTAFKLRWQGATVLAVTVVGWAISLWFGVAKIGH